MKPYRNSKEQENFIKAIFDESLRQEFINSIDLGQQSKYVREVRYTTKEKKAIFSSDVGMMCCKLPIQQILSQNKKSYIYVTPYSFMPGISMIENYHDFKGVLVNHEAKHAEDNFNEYRVALKPEFREACKKISLIKFIKKIFRINIAMQELRAYDNEIRNFSKKNSESYTNSTKENKEIYREKFLEAYEGIESLLMLSDEEKRLAFS